MRSVAGPSVRVALAAFLAAAGAGLAGDVPTECPGYRARLSRARVLQGGVVLLEVEGAAADGPPAAAWDGRSVRFWRSDPQRTFRALLGVDVARPAGENVLVLQHGAAAPCRVAVEVAEAGFGTRELRVAERFVDLRLSDRLRAEEEAARLEAIFAAASPERLWRGPFRLPLRGREPTPNFGQRRILNGETRSQHSGVDFRARAGTPVRAAQRGRVALAEPLFWSGRTVILDHGLGLFTVYGHLSAIDVRVGRLVAAGARLGRVGATGRVTGPHLHWSVRLDGARVDPLELVSLEEGGP
jgi:hypothetical protein